MIVQPTVGELVSALFRRKWTIIICTLVIAGGGMYYLSTLIPSYRSEAAVVVRFTSKAVPTTNLARDSPPISYDPTERRELVQAHADILGSPDIARSVIEQVGLGNLYPSLVENPPLKGTPIDAAVLNFDADLLVDPETTGDVIRLSFLHGSPAVAQEVLKQLIEDYMQRESAIFSGSTFAFQKTQTDQALKRLTDAQTELATYKAASGVTEFDSQINALIKQRSDVNGRLQTTQVALEQARQRRDALTQLLKTVQPTITNSAGEKYHGVDEAQTRLTELQMREREILTTYGSNWPTLAAIRSSIAEAKSVLASRTGTIASRAQSAPNEVYQTISTDLLRYTADVAANDQSVQLLKQQSGDMDREINQLESSRAGLNERNRDVEVADAAYRALALHLEDSRVTADRLRDGISHSAIISVPSLPYQAAKPRYRLMGLGILVTALLAGISLAFVIEFFDDRLISAEQVMRTLKVPVLATFDSAE